MSDESFDGAGLAGKTVGRCRLVAYLGAGGMGYVYRATHHTLGLPRAVKILPAPTGPGAKSAIIRFAREAQQAAKVDHPNVVRVFDFGQEAGLYYIEMEFVQGHDLATQLARRGSLPESETLQIAVHACDALTAAHALHLIHRDIKPANILLCESGTVKVADFGLVKSLSEIRGLTNTGFLVGTPPYMAPEAWMGRNIDPRYDLYSLGATLFCALSGKPPFEGTAAELMRHHLETSPPDLRTAASGVSDRLAEIVARCLAKSPADRHPSAAALAEELRVLLSESSRRAQAPTIDFEPDPSESRPRRAESRPRTGPPATGESRGSRPRDVAVEVPIRQRVYRPSSASGVQTKASPPKRAAPARPRRRMARLFRDPLFQTACVLFLIVMLWLLNMGQAEPEAPQRPKPASRQPPPPTPEEEVPEIKPKPEEVYVAPGTAILGTSEGKHENPLRTVRTKGFYIDKYEVTNRQYLAFLEAIKEDGDAAYAHPDQPAGKNHEPKDFGKAELQQPERPVVGIDWFDAYAYAHWAGKRLPTADEWERAARGPRGLHYPWGSEDVIEGDLVRAHCRESQTPDKLTLKPGSTGSDLSPEGCYDMAGNVMEWTATLDANKNNLRVIKGGGFSVPKSFCVTFGQSWAKPDARDVGLGFRCARDAP